MAKVLNRSSSACPPLVLGVGAGPARGASACRAAGRACRTGSGRPTSLRTRSTSRCGPWKPSAASALPACSHSFAARSSRLLARTFGSFSSPCKTITCISTIATILGTRDVTSDSPRDPRHVLDPPRTARGIRRARVQPDAEPARYPSWQRDADDPAGAAAARPPDVCHLVGGHNLGPANVRRAAVRAGYGEPDPARPRFLRRNGLEAPRYRQRGAGLSAGVAGLESAGEGRPGPRPPARPRAAGDERARGAASGTAARRARLTLKRRAGHR